MDTILNYLDNMFASFPDTADVRAAKENLASMMEDKYYELLKEGKSDNEAVGIVISEFGNIKEIEEELGVTQMPVEKKVTEYRDHVIEVSNGEALNYVQAMEQSAKKVALGVFLCIFSPVILLILSFISDMGGLNEKVAGAVGVVVLLGLVACAVVIFIINGSYMEKYESWKKSDIAISDGIRGQFQDMLEETRRQSAKKVALGVFIIILGVIFLIAASFTTMDWCIMMMVPVLLVFVAIAVVLFITAGSRKEALQVLLQEGEFSPQHKNDNKLVDAVAAIYWPVIVAIYLGWSFWTNAWGTTWIIWPVAGVLFGAIAAACSVITKASNK